MRSTKKIKSNGQETNEERSLKDTLMTSPLSVETFQNSSVVEEWDSDSDDETDEKITVGIPMVKLTKAKKKELREPWRMALIIKVLGESISYNVLVARVTQMWRLSDEFDLIFLGSVKR